MYDGKNAAMKIFIGQKRKKPTTRFWRLRLGVTAASPLGIQRAPVLPPVSAKVRVSGSKWRAAINQWLHSLMMH